MKKLIKDVAVTLDSKVVLKLDDAVYERDESGQWKYCTKGYFMCLDNNRFDKALDTIVCLMEKLR